MNDHAIGLGEILEAAVHEHISVRCRPAYFHDVRSGLQAIQSSIELMTRSAAAPGDNTALARKACEYAKRAVATHEITVSRVLDDLIAQQHAAQTLDFAALAREAVQFLQSMAVSKDLSLSLEAHEGILTIVARRQRLRMAILGLICHAIQVMPAGSPLRLSVERHDSEAWLRFGGLSTSAPLTDNWSRPLADMDLDDLIVPVASRVVAQDGGRMNLLSDAPGAPSLVITFPLA
jgi:hypothetical protein